MYEIDKNAIEEKIRSAIFSENEEGNKSIKGALISIIDELCNYTTDVNRRLINASGKVEEKNRIDTIYTALLPVKDEDEYEAAGLYKMAEPLQNRYFLDCEYNEIRNIIGDLSGEKSFKGKYIKENEVIPFEYSLVFDDSFLKIQEKIFAFAEHYNIKNPIIFSPYSHKSVLLKYDNALVQDGVELNFCFKENKMPIIGGEYCLYWNINLNYIYEKTYDAKEPYGDNTRYIFSFAKTKKGNYLLPLPINNQTCIYDISFTDKSVDIQINHEIEDFIILEYKEFDTNSNVAKNSQSKRMLFINEVNEDIQRKRRLLSEGDIERAVNCFTNWQEISCERSEGNRRHILRYSKKFRADRKNRFMFNAIKREYIHFCKSDERFLTDYANYVLEYLEYYYPEIEWAGEE